ncbi:tetratricopeptide repeat protein [Streptomyces sp. NPDC051963]|uniref:tetratricopeptide repeat protein n=1 Tax=Streptomyces sp. NPDC051963 TaxID=3365678 RepID=UPI0037D91FB6
MTQTYYAAARFSACWPHLVGALPPLAECFQHRAAADALAQKIAAGSPSVLSGTGGVGKTQLAAFYARTAWQAGAVDLLVWVTASSRDAIISGYANAGADVADAAPADPEQAATRSLAWAETTDRRWLIILDDLADLTAVRGLWPPEHHRGRVLVTTRRRDAALRGHSRHFIGIDQFTSAEAAAYLTAKLAVHNRQDDPEQIVGLAADLEHLPLALAQAVAYLIDLELDCSTYRERLADRARTLPGLLPETGSLPDDQAVTVAATWSLSIDRADRLSPEGVARPLMHLASLLDPNGIPITVLTSPSALAYLTAHRAFRNATGPIGLCPPVTEADAADALRCLHRLSLADHTSGTSHNAVRVHRLAQRVTRESLTDDQRDALARVCADALLEVWPQVERDTALAQALRANTNALTRHAQHALWRPVSHPVLFHTGNSLGSAGLAATARSHFHDLHITARQQLGPDHSHTLTARANLAYWQGVTGDVVGAVAAFEELLTDMLRVLGPDDPHTLTARANLAYWRGMVGDAAGAATAFEGVLTDEESALGPDHPHTLTARAGLAYWRRKAGDVAGATTAYEDVLADRKRVLGHDHPDTLTTRHNLAYWQGETGDAVGAVAAFEELLTDMLRVLGPDHPHTLTARHNLARWRGEAGDAVGAVAAFEELLTDMLRVLGHGHPDTLTTRHNLAYCWGVTGNADAATAALQRVLADQERVLGSDHPDTLITRHNLARWRAEVGNAE